MNKNKSYELYKIARNAAWETLIKCEISSLPVDLHKIIKYLNYQVHTYSNSNLLQIVKNEVKNGDGFILIIDSKKHIYLNDNIKNYGRRRFTLAHEIGHGILNHSLETIHFRHPENASEDNEQEYQANIFARDLLAPACILKELNINTTEQIMKICSISKTSAEIRKKRIEKLIKANKFYISPMEQKVLNNFKHFIYKQNNNI